MAAGTAAEALANTIAWFEVNSGWAPPDPDELAEWMADGVCRCPDDCLAEPEGWCEHGLASWWLVLDALEPVEEPDPDRPCAGGRRRPPAHRAPPTPGRARPARARRPAPTPTRASGRSW